jgi:folate-binding protein YgfZ
VCSRDILAQTLKRLGMFVLRAKVRLSDASAEVQLAGLAGSAIYSIAAQGHSTLGLIQFEQGKLVWLHPAGTQARALWIGPTGVNPPAGPVLDTALWLWGEVLSGVAPVTAPIVDAFVPQMLNYESVGGVNFKKGCYPGQEVVARSQFRGQIKRRAFLVRSELPLTPGQEMQLPGDDQASTLVVQAAPLPENGSGATFWDAIVSGHLSGEGIGALEKVADGDATRLYSKSIPYFLLADI